jgi:ArsR family transcriptional regulator, cadmium/lead-responsive transcriptional repressor
MVTDPQQPQRPPSVSAAPSLASDLSWLLSVAARPSMQARYPQLAEMFNGRELLADSIRAFWGDRDDETCFEEMQILANHAGATTETNPDALWRAIERAVRTVPLDLEMPSEDPQDRAMYIERFRRLKESPELLRSYLELLEEVWAPVNDMWQQALPLMEESGRHVVAQFERGRSLETLIPTGCDILASRLPEIVTSVESGQSALLFVPCLFFGSSMYLELAGRVVIGTGVGHGDMAARARTETVAKRLKAVADPTRLALLHSLATAPSTVGELAVLFRLAQPTVSMHVKVLRESGLVQSRREAGRLRLSADATAVEALLSEVRDAVLQGVPEQEDAQGSSTAGSDLIPATVVEATRSGEPVTA